MASRRGGVWAGRARLENGARGAKTLGATGGFGFGWSSTHRGISHGKGGRLSRRASRRALPFAGFPLRRAYPALDHSRTSRKVPEEREGARFSLPARIRRSSRGTRCERGRHRHGGRPARSRGENDDLLHLGQRRSRARSGRKGLHVECAAAEREGHAV